MTKHVQCATAMLLLVCAGAIASTAQAAPDWDALGERILTAAGEEAGFCVDLRCGGGGLALSILKRSQFFVHALETDDGRVDQARERLEPSGLYGVRVAVERGRPDRLPYGDYCANLIIRGDLFADGPAGPPWKEVLRLLRPGGLAYMGQTAEAAGPGSKLTAAGLREQLRQAGATDFEVIEEDGVWAKVRRGRPSGAGDWSHGRWGTAGNNPCVEDELVKAPFQTLWIAGPRSFTKFGLPLASNGRVLLRHGGITREGRWEPPARGDLIQAFDAYNGTLLWDRRLPELAGEGFVALGENVFAAAGTTLYAVRAADGQVRWKAPAAEVLPGMKDFAWYACADGVVVVVLYDEAIELKQLRDQRKRKGIAGLRADDGRVIWSATPEPGLGSVALGGGRAFCELPGRELIAVEIATGRRAWSQPVPNAGGIRFHRNRLYTAAGVFDAADGRLVQKARFAGILVGERAYAGGFKGVSAVELATGKKVETFPVPRDPYCPKTGIPDGCSYMYGRCIVSTASTHCFFFTYSGTVIGDLTRNELFPAEAFRSNCRTGVIAGNGLVYNSPSGCGCAFAVRGGVALAPVDEAFYWARPKSDPPPQLEKGPAYAEPIAGEDSPEDWPCYRHDAARSNVTAARLALPLKQQWKIKIQGGITPPAVACSSGGKPGGTVFVGSRDHSVAAFDSESGKLRWRYRTGGEVPVTPTVRRGRVYAGSQDGWAYCLRADDGRLIWRFRGAPHERKMLLSGRPQSLWPVAGGVIVEDGVAYFYAGYCSHDRVFVCALDADDGKVMWQNDRIGRAVELSGPAGGISPHGVSPGGVLAASKDILYVPHNMYVPAGLRRSDGKLLWWTWRGDSPTRSNIEVQHIGGPELMVSEKLLFLGGVCAVTGSSQPFTAVDARTGRFWGADHPALFARAGRNEAGKVAIVEKSMFGTKPIRFGEGMAPVVVDGGIFTFGYRGGFHDLDKLLQTQFGAKPEGMARWASAKPPGTLIVAGEKVFIAAPGRLEARALPDGKLLWKEPFEVEGGVMPDGLAAAGGKLFAATRTGEIYCFAPVERP